MRLLLRLIFRRRCLNFINVRTAYASKIQAPPTKNPLANSGTTRFREHIIMYFRTRFRICRPRRNFAIIIEENRGKCKYLPEKEQR